MKKILLILLIFSWSKVMAQMVPLSINPGSSGTGVQPLSVDQIRFNDSTKAKIYFLKNGRTRISVAGTKTRPSLNLISLDSGFSTQKEIALILGSYGGTQLISEIGLRGDGGIYLDGQRSMDTTSGNKVFAKFYYDSTMINVAGTEFLKVWGSVVQVEKNMLFYNQSLPGGFAPNLIFKTVTPGDSAIMAYGSAGVGEFTFDHMVALPNLAAGNIPFAGAMFWSGDSLILGTGGDATRISMHLKGASVGQAIGWNGGAWVPTTVAGGTATVNKFGVKLSDGSVNLYPDSLLQFDVTAFALGSGQSQRADVSINPVGTIQTGTLQTLNSVKTDTLKTSINSFVVAKNKLRFESVTSNLFLDVKNTNGKTTSITQAAPVADISQTIPGRAGTYLVSPDAQVAGGLGYTDATDWKVLSPTNGSFVRGGSSAISYYDVYGSVSSWTADQRLGGAAIFPRLVLFNSTNSDSNGFQIRAGGLGMKFLRGWIGLPDAAAQSTTTGDLINSGNKLYFTEASNAKKRLVSQGDKFDFYFRTGVDTVIVTIPGMTVSGTGIPTWSTIRQTYGNLKMAYAQSGSVVIYSSAVEQVDSLHGTFVVIDY